MIARAEAMSESKTTPEKIEEYALKVWDAMQGLTYTESFKVLDRVSADLNKSLRDACPIKQ